MYRESYPKCEVAGSQEIVLGEEGMHVPAKCLACPQRKGARCARAEEQMGRKQLLDHGRCFKEGPVQPVAARESEKGYFLYIPSKCQACEFLQEEAEGFFCGWKAEPGSKVKRSLDWGDFEPIHPLVGLEEGYLFSPRVLRLVRGGREGEATVLMRQMNPELDFNQVRKVYKRLKSKLL